MSVLAKSGSNKRAAVVRVTKMPLTTKMPATIKMSATTKISVKIKI